MKVKTAFDRCSTRLAAVSSIGALTATVCRLCDFTDNFWTVVLAGIFVISDMAILIYATGEIAQEEKNAEIVRRDGGSVFISVTVGINGSEKAVSDTQNGLGRATSVSVSLDQRSAFTFNQKVEAHHLGFFVCWENGQSGGFVTGVGDGP